MKKILSIILVITLLVGQADCVIAAEASTDVVDNLESQDTQLPLEQDSDDSVVDDVSEDSEFSDIESDNNDLYEKTDSENKDVEAEEGIENTESEKDVENIDGENSDIQLQDNDNMENTTPVYAEIDDNMVGGYRPGDLDCNTPVYDEVNTYSDIPSSFQSALDNYPENRNQNPYGTCWAFSTIGLAEFDLINKGYASASIDLSELQLIYYTFNSVIDPIGGTKGDQAKFYNSDKYNYLNYGGNYENAMRRLAQWNGVIKEEDVPYDQADKVIDDGLSDEYACGHNAYLLNNAYIINMEENTDAVKRNIMDHGAIGAMYLHNNMSLTWNDEKEVWTYYDTDYSGGGHAVMVVGWDDNFSKDNFLGTEKPDTDGAWLIRNSWGNYVGYFWMSYETVSLSTAAWVFDFGTNDKWDNNYQLDGGLSTYYDSRYTNVFKVQNVDGVVSETLKSVQLSFTHTSDVKYTIEVYTDLTNPNDPLSGNKQERATTLGETTYAGIYTIDLNEAVKLNPGSYFSIVVLVDKNSLDYEQAIYYADGDDMVWECPAFSNKDSFYSTDGKNYYQKSDGNYCIKAFTVNNKGISIDELADQHRDDVEDGTYIIKSAINNGYVLDVYGGSTNNKANVQIYSNNSSKAQNWIISHDEKGYIVVTNAASKKVLDVDGANTKNGANIQQYEYNGSKAQKWIGIKAENGSVQLISALNSNICMDLSGGETVNGANIQIYESNESEGQRWIFTKVVTIEQLAAAHRSDIEDGTYIIESAINNNYVLNVTDASNNNKANVQIYSKNESEIQKWIISHDTNGYITIMNAQSKKVLDVSGASTKNGTNIQQYESNGSRAQKWVGIKQEDGSVEFISALNCNICVDLSGGKAVNNANIQIYSSNGSRAQKWILTKTLLMSEIIAELASEHKDDIKDGTYVIKSAINSNYVLQVAGSSNNNKANVQLYTGNGSEGQKWIISHDTNGYITVMNAQSKKVLDVNGASTKNGTNIQQYTSNGSRAQKWIGIKSQDGSIELVSALNRNICMDLSGGKAVNSANIQIYNSNGSRAQKWTLTSTLTLDELAMEHKEDIEDGAYIIRSAVNSKYVLDVAGGSKNDKANIQLYADNGSRAQDWVISHDSKGYIILTNAASKKVLDISGASTKNGTNIQQYTNNGSRAQKWIGLKHEDGSVELISALDSNICIDLSGGKAVNKANIQIYSANKSKAQHWNFKKIEFDGYVGNILSVKSCMASYEKEILTIKIDLGTNVFLDNMTQQLYIFQMATNGTSIRTAYPASYKDHVLTANIKATAREARSCLMNHYSAGIYSKYYFGYQQMSKTSYITNPEDIAGPTGGTDSTYAGFYEGKIESKKGMQGYHKNATSDLGIQAALVNINLNELIKTSTNVKKNGAACYQPYVYKGKTYYFHDMISYQKTIFYLNGWGDGDNPTSPYGGWRKNVSLNLLLGWDNELTYLIAPSARKSGEKYYALNMTDSTARETFEALFCYMTEKLGGSKVGVKGADKYRVCNWVLGNEVNACNAWNYAGGISTKDCADNYAKAFQLLYQAVKGTDENARVFISLDHSWNVGPDGHSGKAYLDEFAAYMYATAPHMKWNVDYHPYSNPLYKNDFWTDSDTTPNKDSAPYISMRNLSVLTNYLGKIEEKYHMSNKSIRVILGEQGYVAANSSQERQQAAALAYAFYIGSMNTRVDAIINRAYVDAKEEGRMTLGLMYTGEKKKEAYNMYKNLGRAASLETTKSYVNEINKSYSRWEQQLPGLTKESFFREVQ